MLIDKAEIERVKRANELVGFIRSRGVSLTRRGKQLVGLCPFHDDHEPSLVVDAKKQLWNCLGACREGGDVYRFVMKADGVDFREAHRRLGGNDAAPQSARGTVEYPLMSRIPFAICGSHAPLSAASWASLRIADSGRLMVGAD